MKVTSKEYYTILNNFNVKCKKKDIIILSITAITWNNFKELTFLMKYKDEYCNVLFKKNDILTDSNNNVFNKFILKNKDILTFLGENRACVPYITIPKNILKGGE